MRNQVGFREVMATGAFVRSSVAHNDATRYRTRMCVAAILGKWFSVLQGLTTARLRMPIASAGSTAAQGCSGIVSNHKVIQS